MTIQAALRLADQARQIFTIQYPPSREYFRERYGGSLDTAEIKNLGQTLIYVHVPFCERKCTYCNFAVDVRRDPELHQAYVLALTEQMGRVEALLAPKTQISGIDIGGGTPTLLSPQLLTQLLQGLEPLMARTTSPRALSVETTPSIAAEHPERLRLLASGGVQRVSVGIQSSQEQVLQEVGRRAPVALAHRAVESLRKAGFARINADFIFGLPHQSLAHWKADIEFAIALGVDSVTTYDCLYRGQGRPLNRPCPERTQPSAQLMGALYDGAYEWLGAAGYAAPYGSLNFSRFPGESGTSAYFEGRLLDGMPYLGLGNYASSLVHNTWWFAPHATDEWLKAIRAGAALPPGDSYHLPPDELMAKYLLLSLSFGLIDPIRFRRVFGQELRPRFGPALDFATAQGWLRPVQPGLYGLVEGSFEQMPWLRALFYPKAALDWVAARSLDRG